MIQQLAQLGATQSCLLSENAQLAAHNTTTHSLQAKRERVGNSKIEEVRLTGQHTSQTVQS